ncbi:MAG: hypothetical protein C4334_10620 [Pyrinomonas sp.]|uniref:histidine kinase dimerization/phospho-acceptor domain-containing protein n=1 Tax=Pyrinomonas sp. TaxID=2080306 RepID=UPI00331F0529
MSDSARSAELEIERLCALIKERDEQLAEINRIVAKVRHNINNPLAGIIGQAQLLLRAEDIPAKYRERIEKIEALAARLKEIVGELNAVKVREFGSGA